MFSRPVFVKIINIIKSFHTYFAYVFLFFWQFVFWVYFLLVITCWIHVSSIIVSINNVYRRILNLRRSFIYQSCPANQEFGKSYQFIFINTAYRLICRWDTGSPSWRGCIGEKEWKANHLGQALMMEDRDKGVPQLLCK